jgi:glucose-6-phosphate 1-dehydrogenase
VPLDLSFSEAFAKQRRRIAYERLLLDLIEGEQTLFVRRDEVEAQWRWIDGIRELWGSREELKTYSAWSWGPSAGIALIERDRRSWND